MHHGMPLGGKFGPEGSTGSAPIKSILPSPCARWVAGINAENIPKYMCTLGKIPCIPQSYASLCPSFLFTIAIPATQLCVSLHSANLDFEDPSRSYGGTKLEIIKGWLRAHSASMHAILSHALVEPS